MAQKGAKDGTVFASTSGASTVFIGTALPHLGAEGSATGPKMGLYQRVSAHSFRVPHAAWL